MNILLFLGRTKYYSRKSLEGSIRCGYSRRFSIPTEYNCKFGA